MRNVAGGLVVALVACGCRRDAGSVSPADSAGAASTLTRASVDSGGHRRSFLFYAPPGATGLRPLVVALHGRLGTGEAEDRLSHLSTVAAREGFLLALPDGYRRSWNDARGVTPASEEGYDDVRFVADLIAYFVAEQRADPARVYVTGMSNGGFMSATIACALADRVAAIAEVAATFPEGFEGRCRPAHPVSAMIVMGEDDPLVPYAGGAMGAGGERGRALSAEATARFWATVDGCGGAPAPSLLPDADPDDGTRTKVEAWSGCQARTEVLLFSVQGGGHTWPGGWQYLGERFVGRMARDWDASERIWAFFKDKRR